MRAIGGGEECQHYHRVERKTKEQKHEKNGEGGNNLSNKAWAKNNTMAELKDYSRTKSSGQGRKIGADGQKD